MGRPLRGSRLASFYTSDTEADPVTPPSLSTLDSAFQLQEYIGAVVRLDPHDIERIVKVPGANTTANGEEEKEKDTAVEDERVSVDEACWIYEQLRRLAQDLTHPLITMLQQECTRQTCPEMKAGEWLYLCVAHGNSGAMEHCCAIDYIVHTLDSATALLNSPRAFPSRPISSISIPQTSHRHFPSLARRLGRIFAHAYHHHRLAFESAEAESALYARFLALSRHFDLVPAEFLVIPERNAQGEEERGRGEADVNRKDITLLTRYNEDTASLPAPTMSTSTSQSPRIGGRARTDTMYLSGGYVSPHKGGSPGVSPGRLPIPIDTALAVEGSQEREQEQQAGGLTERVTEDAVTQEGVNLELSQAATDGVGEQAPDSTVPVRIPGQVLARDFALEPPPPPAALEPPSGDAADNAPGDDVSSQTVSMDNTDTDKEQDDPSSSSLDVPADTPETTASEADDTTTAPNEFIDSSPSSLHSESAIIESLVPVIASHTAEMPEIMMPEAQAELSPSVVDESVIAPDPDVPEVTSEVLKEDVNVSAGASHEDEDVVVREEEAEVKEDESIATVETLTKIEEASIDDAENPLPVPEELLPLGGT